MPPSSPDRRQRLLDGAARLIAHYGYDKTTVDDIVREAGVSKGAFYLHWTGKEAMFDDLLVEQMQRALANVLARIQADPQGGRLGRMYRHAVLVLYETPLLRALYARENRILGDYMRRQGAERYTRRFFFGQDFVRQMQAAGLVRDDQPPEVIAYLMVVIAYGWMGAESLVPDEQAPTPEALADALADLAERSFARPGGDSETGKRALAAMIESVREQYGDGEPGD